MPSTKTVKGLYNINLSLVYGLRSIGGGLENSKMPCAVFDISGLQLNLWKRTG